MFQKTYQDGVTKEQVSWLAELLTRHQAVFSQNNQNVEKDWPGTAQHSSPRRNSTHQKIPYRLGQEQEVECQIQNLLAKGMIETASKAWSCPIVLVWKKDQSWRFCVDYKKLNAITLQDAYPLPRIDESLNTLAGSRFFSI